MLMCYYIVNAVYQENQETLRLNGIRILESFLRSEKSVVKGTKV